MMRYSAKKILLFLALRRRVPHKDSSVQSTLPPPQVLGQTQDMVDLQRILLRGNTKLSDNAQQNMTRWAVYNVASLLRQYGKEYEALVAAMGRGATVDECVLAIESAS